MLGCKKTDTLMDSTKKTRGNGDRAPIDKGRYQRLVGRLIYLSHTRPSITFSVNVTSQYMNNPTEVEAVYRIPRYLKMTPRHGLLFKKGENKDVEVFFDADWARDVLNRQSTSGYHLYVWANLVTWRSKKKSMVSGSTTKVEFRALALGICEGMWLQRLHNELGVTT